jgi:Tol biopolymer transport system component
VFQKLALVMLMVLTVGLSCSKPTGGDDFQPYDCQRASDAWACWSAEGRYITYTRQALDSVSFFRYGQRSIWMYDTETGSYGFLVGPGIFPRWNPQGTILAFNWQKTIYFFYPDEKYVRQVTDPGEIYVFNWSYNGAQLIFNGRYGGEYGCIIIDTLGNRIRDVLPESYRVAGVPAWSNAGDRILLAASDSLNHVSVFLVDTLGSFIRDVLPYQGFDVGNQLCWSSDESRFAVDVNLVDNEGRVLPEVWIFDMDGQLQNSLGSGYAPQWSPTNSQIVFQRNTVMIPPRGRDDPGCSRRTIWVSNSDGSDMHELLGWPQPEPDSTMFGGGYNWPNPPPQ